MAWFGLNRKGKQMVTLICCILAIVSYVRDRGVPEGIGVGMALGWIPDLFLIGALVMAIKELS